jgi:hypothetical protein
MSKNADELRVLVVAPTGRDGELICGFLEGHDIPYLLFPNSQKARIEMEAGVGVVIIAEEALSLPEIDLWAAEIAGQPTWSDVFFLLLTVPGERSRKALLAQKPLGNVVLLERPVRSETLISTVQAALRSRHRQYQMRDNLVAVKLA